jgi:F-type H+-transporting ATPase subunit delta
MKFSPKQYAEALYDSISKVKPSDQDKVLDNFVSVLAANGDLKLYDNIAEEFHKLELKEKGVTQATVTSAKGLNADNEKRIIKELNDLVKGKVELKKKIDENVIGGVVIQLEDTLIDASVKRSLQDLKNNLEN